MTFFYSGVIWDILYKLSALSEQVPIEKFLNMLQDYTVPLLSTVGAHYTNAKDISEVYSAIKISEEHNKA